MSQDLGNIRLEANAKALSEVEVTGQRSAFQMNIDKKVFNVDRNLTSAGGTAADVLKSVPSVNVDIDGNVKVRNSSPNIFVDGKPSTLTIDQIPADAIESVGADHQPLRQIRRGRHERHHQHRAEEK